MDRRGRRPLYAWDRWFGAGSFRLARGTDYHCATTMMVQQVRNQARRRRLSVQVIETRDGMDVTVIGVLDSCPT